MHGGERTGALAQLEVTAVDACAKHPRTRARTLGLFGRCRVESYAGAAHMMMEKGTLLLVLTEV